MGWQRPQDKLIADSYISEGTNPKGTIRESCLKELARWKVREGGGFILQSANFPLVVGGGGSLSIQLHGPPNMSLQAWLRPLNHFSLIFPLLPPSWLRRGVYNAVEVGYSERRECEENLDSSWPRLPTGHWVKGEGVGNECFWNSPVSLGNILTQGTKRGNETRGIGR